MKYPVVAVTAGASPAGQAVVRALLAGPDDTGPARGLRPKQVIAIDGAWPETDPEVDPETDPEVDPGGRSRRPPARSTLERRTADLASPEVVDALSGADVVVHIATADDLPALLAVPVSQRRGRAVRATQAVTTAAAAVGAQRLVVVTSAMVLGARADNPVPLQDDTPRRAAPDDGLIGDLLEIEQVLQRSTRTHPGLALTVLRPAALVGPGVDSAVTRHFEAPRLLVLRGAATRWQFCHLDDLAGAVRAVLAGDLDGWFTVAAESSLGEDDVERLSGMRRLEVPAGLAFSTAERLHRVGVLSTPAAELAFVVHPWVVAADGLRAVGWRPTHDNEDCLRELLEVIARRRAPAPRRVDRREAAMGAAGAAVALLGTAAIVRQARSRQSRRRRPTLDP